MADTWKVPAESLRHVCDVDMFKFNTTMEVEPLEGMIGQERAVRSVGFGLANNKFGYNIFMSGVFGAGKLTYAQDVVNKIAATEPPPADWCYVNNFVNPAQPRVLKLPFGMAKLFKADAEDLIEDLHMEISKAFHGEDYEREKAVIMQKFQEERMVLMEALNSYTQQEGFIPQWTQSGFASVPVLEGKPLTAEEFQKLDPKVREEIEQKSQVIRDKALEFIHKIQRMDRRLKEEMKKLDNRIGLFAVGHLIETLKEKYKQYPSVIAYLEAVRDEVLDKLDDFRPKTEEENPVLALFKKGSMDNSLGKYKVNVLISHDGTTGAPVVIESNPTYYNLIGRMEYENRMGVVTTDFGMIKAGALHRANGGYLILNTKDVLSNPFAWEGLKRVLKNRELVIENLGEQFGAVALSTLRPEPIPIDVKVILIGDERLYQLLYHYDEDFRKLFKIKADFDVDMERTKENVLKLAQFISCHCQQNDLKHFDRSGVAKVVEFSTRIADHQDKLTTRFNELVEIICEADTWATLDGAPIVTDKHVTKAVEEKKYRSNRIEERIQEMFEQGIYLMDVQEKKVGQINGLSVLNVGNYMFGKPSRITANTYIGKGGVVNIEREIELSGPIHSKGVLTLAGYLGEQYAQHGPLSLAASLTFEQAYEGVDGDSASSTELYALLSSLAEIPIKQSIAVTGSVNQKGEIQPVGGVTQKIEGFFTVCKTKGLTGEQGVMLPWQNIKNLVLNEEVCEAVRKGQFHIYAAKTIDEGIELLTGLPAGQLQTDGTYPPGTVHYLVQKKLQQYTDTVVSLNKKADEK
jgi:lon-related putative ATP-dependent protease